MKFIKTMFKQESGEINSSLSVSAMNNAPVYKTRRTMMALEPRIMFDGAAAATTAEAVADTKPPEQDNAVVDQDAAKLAQAAADVAPPAVQVEPMLQQHTEILFIENNVADYQALIDGAKPGIEVHVLDASGDGLAQMAQVLDGRSGIDAVHIVSHGSEGALLLGSATLTAQNLDDHATELNVIGKALSPNADILLYGCDVGEGSDGAAFVSALAQATQADVAASNDTTGAAALGGDWGLEVSSGYINSDIFFSAAGIDSYHYTLATFDFEGASGDGTDTASQTVGTTTLTAKLTGGTGGTWYVGAGGTVGGSSGNAIFAGGDYDTITFTFNEAIDLSSFQMAHQNANEGLTLTRTGGSGTASYDVTATSAGANISTDWTGITGFTVTKTSGGTWTDGVFDTLVFTPAVTNAAPTLTGNGSAAYTEDGSAVDLFSSITASTNDSGQTFSGMTLTVTNVSDTTEYLVINGIDVALSTSTSGLSLSTVSAESAGSVTVTGAGSTKTVTITGAALSDANMGTLIDGITYRDSSQAPSTASSRVVTITGITDSGSSSNTATPNIAATVTVAAVNDAPTGLGNLTLTAVNEDTASPSGTAINTLTGLSFADVDAGSSLGGVAVVGNTANSGTQGVWQYSTNAGTNWFAIGTVADNSTALALSAATLVRFVPVADYNGTPTALTVRALDNTNATGYSTTAGSETRVTLNASVNGGTTAISTNTNTIGTSITAVNDVPVRTAGSLSAITVNEDSANATAVTLGLSSVTYGPGGGTDESGPNPDVYDYRDSFVRYPIQE